MRVNADTAARNQNYQRGERPRAFTPSSRWEAAEAEMRKTMMLLSAPSVWIAAQRNLNRACEAFRLHTKESGGKPWDSLPQPSQIYS